MSEEVDLARPAIQDTARLDEWYSSDSAKAFKFLSN
jgi:hypothetical protein